MPCPTAGADGQERADDEEDDARDRVVDVQSAAGHVVVERPLAGADHAGDRAGGQEREDERAEAHEERHVDPAAAEVQFELELHRSDVTWDRRVAVGHAGRSVLP